MRDRDLMDETLTTEAAAEYLHLSEKTLRNWRSVGGGPRFTRAGGRILYKRSWLDEFLAKHEPRL